MTGISSIKTYTTESWGAVIHSIIIPEAGTYLVGANYSATAMCYSDKSGYRYINPGGTFLITVDERTTIDFKSATGSRVTWTDFLPYFVKLRS